MLKDIWVLCWSWKAAKRMIWVWRNFSLFFWFFFVGLRCLFLVGFEEKTAWNSNSCKQEWEKREVVHTGVKNAAIRDHSRGLKNNHKAWEPVQLGKLTLPSEPFKHEHRAWNPECWLRTCLGGAVWPRDDAVCTDACALISPSGRQG